MEIVNCMGFNVFSGRLDEVELTAENKLLNTISPISYGISTNDKAFRHALKASDILVLDGMSFGLSGRLLRFRKIVLNQGPEVFYFFMKKMNEENGKVFFLGAANKTLEKMKQRACVDYPNVKVDFFSPPYKAEFSKEETNIMLEKVNRFQPDILFVGMTCPKQEKWAFDNKNTINARLTCSIGAVFDWYAGVKPIAPIWWKLRLAWLKRAIDRPEVLKRYPHIAKYFWHLSLALLGVKKYRYGTF
jgi:N-acetylglucosaminyldiphosphoundecaprenol N-acetyl-beta-D-mannosaminyltransferase